DRRNGRNDESVLEAVNFDLEFGATTEVCRTLPAQRGQLLDVALERLRVVLDDKEHAREFCPQPGILRPAECDLAPPAGGLLCHWPGLLILSTPTYGRAIG